MLEGTRTNLVQSGLPLQYWPMAMQHFSMAVNATPQLNGDDAPWKLRFEEDFPGQLIPFGAKILFWNNPKRVDNTSGKTSPTANDGIFLGYHIQPGFAWKGEYLVAKLEALDYHAETGSITVQRARRVELIAGGFVFPSRTVLQTMSLLILVRFRFNLNCKLRNMQKQVKKQLTSHRRQCLTHSPVRTSRLKKQFFPISSTLQLEHQSRMDIIGTEHAL